MKQILKCNNCKAEVKEKEIINKSIKKYSQILCEKCFKNYEVCEIVPSKERTIGDGKQLRG